MFDRFEREIDYLRISVTDRCNLRCVYCVPEERLPPMPRENILSFEQIAEFVRAAAGLGMTKIRLTGGEPLMRRGIADLVFLIKRVPGVRHLAMTTNGILLPEYADSLRAAGLDSVNISLDTLRPSRYALLTRGGSLELALAGIDAAAAAGFRIKINMVILEDSGDGELMDMRNFCAFRGLTLQTIEGYDLRTPKRDSLLYDRPPKCGGCNRLRLLSDGTIKPCLHSDDELKADFSDLENSIRTAVLRKPREGRECRRRNLSEIGG